MSRSCGSRIRIEWQLWDIYLPILVIIGIFFALTTFANQYAYAAGNSTSFLLSNIQFLGPTGTTVTYNVTATLNGILDTAVCSPASNSTFQVGNSIVSCFGFDSNNNPIGSASFTILVTGDVTPPSITAPSNVISPRTGTLSQVQLGNPTVTDNYDSRPFAFNDAPASGFPLGTAMVNWTAMDHSGNIARTQQQVTIIDAPLVSTTSPPNNAQISPGLVQINGTAQTATDNQIITKVELSMDGNASTYQFATPKAPGNWSTWSINYNVPIGNHYLTARVTDNIGRQNWGSLALGAFNTSAPTVAITSPANNAQVNSGMAVFAGTATGGSPISNVMLSIDGNASTYQLATPKAPGNWSTWSINYNVPIGNHFFNARVTDNLGRQAFYAITLTGNPAPPTVSITSPANNAVVAPGATMFSGNTTGRNPISNVMLSIDGNASTYQFATPKAPGNWSTWSIIYNMPVGWHFFNARVTDQSGAQAWYAISLDGVTPPSVIITSPANNAPVTVGSVKFTGTASSGNLITKVELSIDGNASTYQLATPKAAGNWSTWSIIYNMPSGFHYFIARVTDQSGAQAWYSLTLRGYLPPTVAITSPANNAHVKSGPITFSGTASSPKPINFVQLAIDGNASSYQQATPFAPGNWTTWSTTYNIPGGSHYLTARVTDQEGRVAWNSITVIAATSSAPPTVRITSPLNNAHVSTGLIQFTGNTTGGNPISNVMLSIDGNASTYQFATPKAPGNWSTWSINYNVPIGNHYLTARVTDNIGRQAWNSATVIGASQYPIFQMSDTVASGATSVYSAKQLDAEFASSSSALISKQIDTITLQMSKAGSPTGTIQVGVFNSSLSVKQLFGTIDASTLTSSYSSYTFSLTNNALYTMKSGDYIGVKFTGGDANNYVLVMRDWTNKFDGTNSYRAWYNTAWNYVAGDDLYMILKQTHG